MRPLYHRLSANMTGDVLYPLNMLCDIYPDIYAAHYKKYVGREHVPKQQIRLLDNALWNDVIFLSAVHPQKLFDARRAAGFPDLLAPARFVQINPALLDQSKLAVWLFPESHSFSNDDIVPFDAEMLEQYSHIPQETLDYFSQLRQEGAIEVPLFWRYIPHILYKGTINIADMLIIECR